ncbi:DNA cytosine methyltransferase [Pseudomonas putida]|uniref:DNA cytosine methyltransferase n=1 Tax=Pseudomonas putida TaxID=303 RepID=A0A1X0ZLJ3_PSEPU|nr:DNA cytosine methyltransferase [Pseudomonas putida]ORL57142.1 DNA cytosine methyltransferase [Pseudomonas putida]
MAAYYNEIDPYAAQWLRNLVAAGHIAPGDVDERSIEDVHPDDLKPYTQCHFFAGVGVWSYALRRAGWPDDRPVWTGSCPCQPFSSAGIGAGFSDPRHLWPSFAWHIGERLPPVIFGEQVASKDADPWVDLVQADLEAMAYAFGAVPFPSAGVGAAHIRDRTCWVADANSHRQPTRRLSVRPRRQVEASTIESGSGQAGGLANTECWHAAELAGQWARSRSKQGTGAPGELEGCGSLPDSRPAGPVNGLWADADWLFCRDGKWRPVEPGTFPLAHGAPGRVGRLRAYGNAINAEAATQFIAAYLETKL